MYSTYKAGHKEVHARPVFPFSELNAVSNCPQVKEYELSEVFHHTEDERQYEVLRMEHMTRNTIDVLNNNDIEAEIEEERSEEERRIQHLSTTTHAPTISTTVTTTLENST
jgi:hypothetical protein